MKYTISVLVENHPGVLSKVSGLFSRRGFNIDSLAVGVTEDSTISRMTIVVNGDEYIVEQVEKQLNKVIPVIKVKALNPEELISREPLPAPKFWLNPDIKDFYDFTPDDVRLEDYETHPQIKNIPVAI